MNNTPNYNYNLPEYSDSADISYLNYNFANIDANEHNIETKANKALSNVTNEYSSTATYNVGDTCIYNGDLYKCITAIPTAEPFDSTKWEQTTVMESAGESGGIDLSYNTSTIQSTETKIGTMNGEDLYIARCYIAQWNSGQSFVWPVMNNMKEIISMDVSYRDSSGKYYVGGYNGEFTMNLDSAYPASFTSSLTRYHVNLVFIYTKKTS